MSKRRSKNKKKTHRKVPHQIGQTAERLRAAFNIADPRLKILYLIPHLPQNLEDASFFGMYTPGLHDSAKHILQVARLPADVREPYTGPGDVLHLRQCRLLWHNVTPVSLPALEQLAQLELQQLFRIVLTDNIDVANAVDQLAFSDGLPFLHVSTIPGPGRNAAQAFTVDRVLEFADKVLAHLSDSPKWATFVDATRASMHPDNRRAPFRLAYGSAAHNVTAPSEIALLSFSYILGPEKPLVAPGKSSAIGHPKRYIDRICNVADIVSAERRALMRGRPPTLVDWKYIVTVPSVHWAHHRNWQRRRDPDFAGEDLHGFKAAYRSLVQQKSYSSDFEIDGKVIRNGIFQGLIQSRSADQYCYTAGLSILAAATLTPVLRLEPKVNLVRSDLNVLGHCARFVGRQRAQSKLSRLARVAGERMRELVDPQFLSRIDPYFSTHNIQGLKLVSDVPLEWMPIAGVPLGLRYNVSRIPVVPGNLFLSNCVGLPIMVSTERLLDVLVVRSFHANDRLKMQLQNAIEVVLKNNPEAHTKIRFVDVESEDDLVEALNGFDGAIVIFDGHGDYEDHYGIGTIVVGGQPLDVWQLRERCSFPPIVIFSACDTHPLDGSHGSCANAAFALGARTVLATSLPIHGGLASIFIARLMLRLFEFVPMAVEIYSLLTWREVIGGMLRMSYTSEVTRLLIRFASLDLTEEAQDRIQMAANVAINARRADWHDVYLEALCKEGRKSAAEMRKAISFWASMTDALKYVQLGSPENIVIEKAPVLPG